MKANSFLLRARCTFVAATALAWVVSVHPASAQRYSLNALGYTDRSWAAGSNLVANPFDANPNTISNVLRGLPEGSYFIPWNPEKLEYGPTNFYSPATGWTDPEASFATLDSGFLILPEPITMSFVGEVPMGRTCVAYPVGVSLSTVLPEESCAFCLVDPCPPSIPQDTMIWKWNPTLQQWGEPFVYSLEVGWNRGYGFDILKLDPGEAFQIFTIEPFQARTSKTTGRRSAYIPLGGRGWWRYDRDLCFEIPTVNTNGPTLSYTNWSMVRSTNLSSPIWEVVQTGATATGAVTSLTVATTGTNDTAFYRLLPFLPSTVPTLWNAARSGTRFSFEFYAPEAGNYQVQRTTNPPVAGVTQWQTIQTIEVASGTVVCVTDTNAVSAAGYYRLNY